MVWNITYRTAYVSFSNRSSALTLELPISPAL